MSNAFEKSIMIMSICDLLFRDLDRSCVVSINWISVEFLLRKPCCLSDKIECWCMYVVNDSFLLMLIHEPSTR